MATLYVTEPRSTLRKSGESLLVTLNKDDGGTSSRRKILLEVEPHRLELIALVGPVHITSNALLYCLDQAIGVAWFSWNGRFRGRVVPPMARSADLKLQQYAAWQDESGRLSRGKRVITAKLTNARRLLEDIQSNYPGQDNVPAAIARLKELGDRVEETLNRDALLGLEGAAARVYFEA